MGSKDIYLVFAKTGTWLSRLICTFSEIEFLAASSKKAYLMAFIRNFPNASALFIRLL
jgi:hypothetical protein